MISSNNLFTETSWTSIYNIAGTYNIAHMNQWEKFLSLSVPNFEDINLVPQRFYFDFTRILLVRSSNAATISETKLLLIIYWFGGAEEKFQ